jgi:RimJ/RimL family protein N-acetyltransferase
MSHGKVKSPAYRIFTRRLLVRCWEPSDAPALNAAIEANLEHLRPWMPWAMGDPVSLDARIEWLRRCRGEFDLGRDFVYGIFDASGTVLIGGTGLHTRGGSGCREIGYWIGKEHTRQGFATESSSALAMIAFLLESMDRVEIHCDPLNTASTAVPRRLGFTLEATLRRRTRGSDGELHDSMVWSLLASEFPASPCADAQVTAFDAAGRRIL